MSIRSDSPSNLRIPGGTDYEVIASWITDAVSCLNWAGPRVPFPFTSAELPVLLATDEAQSYCFAKGIGKPLGFGQLWTVNPSAVHLGRIIISPAERGRGLGRSLCQSLLATAVRGTGVTSVTLRVFRNNAPALSLYSNLGFVIVKDQCSEDVLFMRLSVN